MTYQARLWCVLFAVSVGRLVEGGGPPGIEWERTFSGGGNDYGNAVQACRDGGYIIAGTYEGPAGTSDIAVIRTDASGLVEWELRHGDASRWETAHDIQQTPDGGFIAVGLTCTSVWNSHDIYLITLGKDGRLLSSKRLGQDGIPDMANAIRPCAEGGFIIAGRTYQSDPYNGDAYLVKIDDEGNESWSASFGTTGIEEAFAVEQTSDGGYIVAGVTHHFLGGLEGDVYLIKTDANGVETWSRSFGGGNHDQARSVKQTLDGGYIITGTAVSFSPVVPKICLIKTNSEGIETWSRTIAGYCEMHGYSVLETADGNYIVGGTTRSSSESCAADGCVLKTDREGTVQWLQVVGAGGDIFDQGYCVAESGDGGYVLAGATGWTERGGRYRIHLAKLASEDVAFVRGDVNADGRVDIADPISLLGFLFGGQKAPPCMKAADANDSGMVSHQCAYGGGDQQWCTCGVDVSDVVCLLCYLFASREPMYPFPQCGKDPTADELTCDSYDACP